MKYFKFTQISAESGVSWMIEQPLSGPSLPHSILPGLTNITQLAHTPAYYIGQVDDSAQPNPDNYIFDLTEEERALELSKHVEHVRNQKLEKIYREEKEYRQAIFSKYDESASIAGVYKYEEAKTLLADSAASAVLIRQEASIRGMAPVALAQKIFDNHESFRSKEAKIAGIRGMVLDRLTSYTFDLNNPDTSVEEFFATEKIGEKTVEKYIDGTLTVVTEDVVVGKYDLAIDSRFSAL